MKKVKRGLSADSRCVGEHLTAAHPASTASQVQLFEEPHDYWNCLVLSRELPAIIETKLRLVGGVVE